MATTKKPRRRSKEPRDLYAEVTDKVIAAIDQGTVPWRKRWTALSGIPARSLATGKEYRGINWMLTGMAGYESMWWLTYKQATERGGQVRQGEHGTPIFLWKTAKVRLNTPEKRDRAIRDQLTIRTDEKGEYAEHFMARTYTVFNASQIDGLDPALTPTAHIDETPSWSTLERCEQIASGYQNGPLIAEGGPRAYYDPRADQVRMPDRGRFDNPTDWYATLYHELAHSTGHSSRLDRLPTRSDGQRGYAREELVAELAAAMLCAVARIDSPPLVEQHAAYLDNWRKALSEDKKLLVIAAQRAQRAADHILA